MTTQRKLPPAERDFDIYHAIQITGSTTRRVAEQNDLSQTRVRQIVARVVQWIAEVLPPEADIAREKRAQLARHIAADRLQHQLEEATELWAKTSAPKYMGLLTRISLANARLGVVSGTIDALAADALEGLPVGVSEPASDPPPEDCSNNSDEPAPPIQNPQSQIPNSAAPSPRRIDAGHADLLNSFRNIWPPSERIRLAVELEEALQFLPPEHREALRAYELHHIPADQLALEAAVRDGLIPADQAYRIDPASYTPPVEDCSTTSESPAAPLPAAAEPLVENHALAPSYDLNPEPQHHAAALQNSLSLPLLTSPEHSPIANLTISPNRPSAPITVITSHT